MVVNKSVVITAPTFFRLPHKITDETRFSKQLIEQTSNENFEPGKYKDTVRERVMEQIQKKVDGQEITTEAAADSGGKIIDLMEALKASLASKKPAAEAPSESKGKKGRKAS